MILDFTCGAFSIVGMICAAAGTLFFSLLFFFGLPGHRQMIAELLLGGYLIAALAFVAWYLWRIKS